MLNYKVEAGAGLHFINVRRWGQQPKLHLVKQFRLGMYCVLASLSGYIFYGRPLAEAQQGESITWHCDGRCHPGEDSDPEGVLP